MDASNGVSDAQNLWTLVGTAIATIIVAAATYLRKPSQTKEEGSVAVISAQFADRVVVEKMAAALDSNTKSMERVTEMLGDLVAILKSDAQRRHDEEIERAAIERELMRRGIKE